MMNRASRLLRELVFVCRNKTPPLEVVVSLAYDASLFSAQRDWPRALVEGRKVIGVRDGG
jgi:hypothetical protein